MTCGQCQMISINGIPCHETGCPNSRKTWIEERGEWVLFLDCFNCGCPVEKGEFCDCQSNQDLPEFEDSEEDSRNARLTRIAEAILNELNANQITFDVCEESLATLSELTDSHLTFGIPEEA